MLRQKCIQLFDVREREEVRETGMIPRSVNIPRKYVTSSKYDNKRIQ